MYAAIFPIDNFSPPPKKKKKKRKTDSDRVMRLITSTEQDVITTILRIYPAYLFIVQMVS